MGAMLALGAPWESEPWGLELSALPSLLGEAQIGHAGQRLRVARLLPCIEASQTVESLHNYRGPQRTSLYVHYLYQCLCY